MTRRLLGSLVVIALVLASVIALPLLIDWSFLAPRISQHASAALDRQLDIDGPIAVGILPSPWIEVGEVRLADADGAGDQAMLRIERARLAVAFRPLLDRRLEINDARIEGLSLALAVDDAGRPNWALGHTDAKATEAAPAQPLSGWLPRSLRVTDGHVSVDRLSYHEAGGGPARVVEDLALAFSFAAEGATIAELASSAVADIAVEIGSVELGAQSWRDVTATASLGGSDDRLAIGFSATEAAGERRTPVAVALAVGEPDALLRGERVAFDGETTIGARRDTVAGDVLVDIEASPPVVRASLDFAVLDLSALGSDRADGQAAADGTRSRDGRVIPATPLPAEPLPELDLEVRLSAERLVAPGGLALDQPQALIVLREGSLSVEDAKAGLAGGQASAAISYAPEAGPHIRVRADASGLQAAQLAPQVVAMDLTGAVAHVAVNIAGQGATTRALAASLSGDVTYGMEGGRFDLGAGALVVKGIGLLLDPILGRGGATPIHCALARWRLDQGVARSRGLVMSSRDLIVSGRGTVDLRSEALDMTFAAKPTDLSLMSFATPFKISGTLAAPSASVAPEDVLGSAVQVAGAVVNPLGVVAVLGVSGSAAPSDCASALDQGARAPATPLGRVGDAAAGVAGAAAQGAGAVVEGAGGAVEGAAKALDRGLKSLFGPDR